MARSRLTGGVQHGARPYHRAVTDDRTAKRLLVMRHAKAAPYEPDADHERTLVDRGRADAGAIGESLRDSGRMPQLVLCSTAARARETLACAFPQFSDSVELRFERRIYNAAAATLADVVNEINESVDTALLIGHNPGMHQLALSLAGSGDDLATLATKFPTAAVADLRFDGMWALLGAGDAELAEFLTPKSPA